MWQLLRTWITKSIFLMKLYVKPYDVRAPMRSVKSKPCPDILNDGGSTDLLYDEAKQTALSPLQ